MTPGTLTPDPIEDTTCPVEEGNAFVGFLNNAVPAHAKNMVRESAISTLAAALQAGPRSTGLVVGRVQSGKTLSYEGVISLARDNDFAVIVVISGSSNPLLAQGETRLKRDLHAADPTGWVFLSPADNQQPADHVKKELARIGRNWKANTTRAPWKETAVVFILKNYGRIQELADNMKEAGLGDSRVLVIDDEADQASLNTLSRRGRESSTYARLRVLRDALPNHYYLQYTATPQAPLLIAIQDMLSPDYVKVLDPGQGYVGGESYFGSPNTRVLAISNDDIAKIGAPAGPPPNGLKQALIEFLIGAAHVVATGSRPETRSMLVHPSRETGSHNVFVRWIRDINDALSFDYNHAKNQPTSKIRTEFQNAWQNIQQNGANVMPFDDCWDALEVVFRNLDIIEVNTRAGRTPLINWYPTKSYILVGGQAIDRGFTVEGLTVTYMPRGGGTFTADTIQQRARFFGYKESYLGFCRVYLEPQVRDAFTNYIEHEREMVKSLKEIEQNRYSLKDWRRRFLLDSQLRPTRASVIDMPLIRINQADKWITDRIPMRPDAITLSDANSKAEDVLSGANWEPDETGRHLVAYVSLKKGIELLESITPPSLLSSEPNYEALAMQFAKLADNDRNDQYVAVYKMRPNQPVGERKTMANGGIEIFAGRSQVGGVYPGDRKVFDPNATLSVQLHPVNVTDRNTGKALCSTLVSAWRLPDSAASDWLIETGR